MRKLKLKDLNLLYKTLSQNSDLYLPTKIDDSSIEFVAYNGENQVELNKKPSHSPKNLFFPQSEDLMQFKTQGKKIEVIDNRQKPNNFIVFGVKPCDAKSIEVLDNVFMQGAYDSFYSSKRESATIVTFSCKNPTETCFCKTFGIDPANPDGDAVCYMDSEFVYFVPKTKKGEELVKSIECITDNADENSITPVKEQINSIMDNLPLKDVSVEKFGVNKTKEFFNSPEWDKLSESCLGCGACTFVCPTCQCYDIKDYNTGNATIRFRCWDSCMYNDFTMMAHGTPRLTQKERFRQRFMHKLCYYPDNNDGMFSCVGCGRCLDKCPINMNIVKVIKTLGGND